MILHGLKLSIKFFLESFKITITTSQEEKTVKQSQTPKLGTNCSKYF